MIASAARATRWMGAIAAAVIALAELLSAGPAFAREIAVRSGEHATFTRIVVEPGEAAPWKFGRAGTGYELRLAQPGHTFDLSDVFRLIPRDRLTAITPGSEESSLSFAMGCECHATAFETAGGLIVIDLGDGPPPPDSVFEAALDDAQPAHDTIKPQARGYGSWVNTPFGFGLIQTGPLVSPLPMADPDEVAVPSGGAPLPAEPSADVRAGEGRTVTADKPDGGTPRFPPGALPAPPDPRVSDAERALLEQIARAAGQGMVNVNEPEDPPFPPPASPGETAPNDTSAFAAADNPGNPAAETGNPPDQKSTANQLAIRSETAIDRDHGELQMDNPFTGEGAACLPDEVLDLASWGEPGRPPADQIATARARIVGEFDMPDEAAIVALAKLYIHLGFGAEARSVLASFPSGVAERPLLWALAEIVDGAPPDPPAVLAGQTDCDTDASLWSVLGQSQASSGSPVNHGALLRAFSELPPHLRQAIGPRLADHFLARGAADVAHAVRDAMARAPRSGARSLALVSAKLDLSRGDAASAEESLRDLMAGNDDEAAEAVILAVESRIARGAAVEPALADAVAALTQERQKGPLATRLVRAHALALAGSGEFDQALALMSDPGAEWPLSERNEILREVFSVLAASPDDDAFFKTYFAHRSLLDSAEPGGPLRVDLARRLSESGFHDEVVLLLSGANGTTEPGRLLLAAAWLARGVPRTAIDLLSGITSEEAMLMSARALELAGEFDPAADVYLGAGRPAEAGRAAWRAGDWERAAEFGPDDASREALAQLGLAAESDRGTRDGAATPPPEGGVPEPPATDGPAAETPGQQAVGTGGAGYPPPAGTEASDGAIATGRALLDESARARTALAHLIAIGGNAATAPDGATANPGP